MLLMFKINRYFMAFLCIGLLCTHSLFAQENLTEGTTGNALELAVTNGSSTFPFPGTVVEVLSKPDWITFTVDSATLGDIAPGLSEQAQLLFDVADGTDGNTGVINLKVTTSWGDEFTGTEDPALDIDVVVGNDSADVAIAYVLDPVWIYDWNTDCKR